MQDTAFVLADDAILFPVSRLTAQQRSQFSADSDDYVISKARSRSASIIVDSEFGRFLERFRAPTTIAQAVFDHYGGDEAQCIDAIEAAFRPLKRLIRASILVQDDSEQRGALQPLLTRGEKVGDFRILRRIHLLEDTEIYQASAGEGHHIALKLVRKTKSTSARAAVEREGKVLEQLSGAGIAPRLLEIGEVKDLPYLAMTWCPGITAERRAEEIRRSIHDGRGGQLLGLLTAIAGMYHELHAQGVIHGDVHPRNIIVDGDGCVKLVDFGLSVVEGSGVRPSRGGVAFYLDPQLARARRLGRKSPKLTRASDQYSLAAVLYFLYVGHHYIDFKVERNLMLEQIEKDEPRPFVELGATPWPELERVLHRGLSKNPEDRFGSFAALRDALSDLAASGDRVGDEPALIATGPGRNDLVVEESYLDDQLHRFRMTGTLFMEGLGAAPHASVNYGAAGVAFMLYRLSLARDDPQILTLADLWCDRAKRWIRRSGSGIGDDSLNEGFYSTELQVSPATVGSTSLYHTAAGVHVVQALINHSMGDFVSTQQAVMQFVESSRPLGEKLDLTLGTAGSLLGCSILLDALPRQHPLLDHDGLKELGSGCLREIWLTLDALPPIPDDEEIEFLGIAHGWAGLLYATMIWCGVSDEPMPDGLEGRLDQLAALAEPNGRGVRWPRKPSRKTDRSPDYMAGWCNGTAGFVSLWTRAAEEFEGSGFIELAERAAWNAWEDASPYASLCCGLAGRAYSLLVHYRATGSQDWLRRARDLARRCVADTSVRVIPHSLYKGEVGVANLLSDLRRPMDAAMPLFGLEGGRSTT